MSLVKHIAKFKFLPAERLMEYYPPFLFMGVKIEHVAKDYSSLRFSLPLRWYSKNTHGTMFGGFICAAADPVAAILCGRIFRDAITWTKHQFVDFIKPGKGRLHATVKITEDDIKAINDALSTKGKIIYEFEFNFYDAHEVLVAKVRNGVYLRAKKKKRAE